MSISQDIPSRFNKLGIDAKALMNDSMVDHYYGAHLFDVVEQDYYMFKSHEKGDAVWIVPDRTTPEEYRVILVEEEKKFGNNAMLASRVSFFHCALIESTWIDDRRKDDVIGRIVEGGKILADKANKPFVEVLLKSACLHNAVELGTHLLSETVADIFSTSQQRGYRFDKFLFPDHLEAKLLQEGFILPVEKPKCQNHIGTTITAQDAFRTSMLPDDTVIIFASAVGMTLYRDLRFSDEVISGPGQWPTPAACGYLDLNPTVKDIRGVVAITGVDQITARSQTQLRVIGGSSVFVNTDRITELQSLDSPNYDLKRLIAICSELNTCFSQTCFLAVAMLTRSALDHIPPIFGVQTFAEVANNYRGSRSFKASMLNLDNSSRKIADAHLHTPIRRKEILPNSTQVDFSNDFDVLLAEIVRIIKD